MEVIAEVDQWQSELESVFARVADRFARADLRRRMRDYVRGLLAPIERKNGWQLAEWAGHRDPAGLQHLLNGARWDADAVRDDVRDYVAERLGPGGVLIIDDTGFIKKGTTSAGVGRQYTGTSGKIDNCQIGVFAAYATGSGRALVDRELYLPKSWTSDRDRCRAAKIPDEREFATKGELARDIVRRCLAAGLPAAWVTADEAYGQDWHFRRLLEQRGVGYVVAVPKSQQIKSLAGMWRIDQLIEEAPSDAWQRLSCGNGAKGPRVYDWAAAKLPANLVFDPDPPTHHRWVMARRSLSDPGETAYYLAYVPVGIEIADLARIAGSRWAIEECFQAAKNECGLDEYEVRRYTGWYRHITLAMLAHAFLAALAAQADGGARGAAETDQPSPRSPWQKSGACWTLSCRTPGPTRTDVFMP
ncbi:IS701 family transposase [Streptomyces sp. CSDS2]|uniref:IS701 family transposase n=1 Tax=Streptomyces sp. CSDS2 TaxID=3055051 RepID=UPI0025B233A4|nr:IS701 family transposase [Streptomyces sp. CSDS2]MDN3265922.1 IS701 family transposase [Streptomyces sp. CSDS2]